MQLISAQDTKEGELTYRCESCQEEIGRVKYCFDPPRDELYLICPFCGGECREKEEPEEKDVGKDDE